MPPSEPDSEPPTTQDHVTNNNTTLIIGISGPSSSGKTTLTRLLQSVFSGLEYPNNNDNNNNTPINPNPQSWLQTFIIHEDDFYLPDDKIPYTKTQTGKIVQDWDTIDAIDVPFLASSLAYVRRHGSLPPRLKSKEDLNEATDSGVERRVIDFLRGSVEGRLRDLESRSRRLQMEMRTKTLAFLEGFLLYSPPESETKDKDTHILRPIHNNIHLHLFLPASYDIVKKRREARSGYVTIGPAPDPDPSFITPRLPQRGSSGSLSEHDKRQQRQEEEEVDLHKEDDRPPQNFWTDPPGYVDDIVWPRYVRDHAWLLLPEEGKEKGLDADTMDDQELIKRVGQGTNVRTDAGVTVAPGQGVLPMVDLLKWAVDEVMRYWETREKRLSAGP